jgi:hypothetical protein
MNSTSLTLTNYLDQLKILPGKGNTLQAQYIPTTDDRVVVYQAYNKNKLVRVTGYRRGVAASLDIK